MSDEIVKSHKLVKRSFRLMVAFNDTELKIIKAAENVFYLKGKEATSMQDIADEAGITRTSLNYYFRSKDKLFEAVYQSALYSFVPEISELLLNEESFREKLPKIVNIVVDAFIANPRIPLFVIQELSINPDRVSQFMLELGLYPKRTFQIMEKDPLLSKIPVDPRQMFMNVLSMCVFPFAAKPIIQPLLYEDSQEAYLEAMRQRKYIIPAMLENMFKSFEL